MRAPSSTTELIELCRKSGIYAGPSLDEKLSVFPNLPSDPSASAALLVKQGILTKFQAKHLLTGRWRGFRLGSYVVREQIGQGGMGAVYLAEHETLQRTVALKVLSPALNTQNSKLSVERFLREARSAAALDHPNIVRIHDVGQQGGMHYLVMEYVEGQTLDELQRKGGAISPSRAVDFIAQTAAGLQHAYEKGFIHRDIKPANLMLTKDGTVKILDMGLARSSSNESDKLTQLMDEGAIVGTADYISPEQAMNAPNIDIRSDIYSLGATFFSLVTGTPPFSGNTTQKLVQHQMKDAPSLTTIDRTFPPGLAKVVSKMLQKKPENRYQSPGEVISAVAEWLPNAGAQRMVASLSGTDLAHSVEMQTTLSELATGGTQRISASKRMEQASKSKPWKLYAGIGTAAVALMVVGLVAALGGFSSDRGTEIPVPKPIPEVAKAPPVTPTPQKTPAKKASPAPATPTPVKVEKPVVAALPNSIIYRLDLAAVEPFRTVIKAKQRLEGENGQLPPGWNFQCYNLETTGEFRVEQLSGQKVMRLANREGPFATQLVFRPDRTKLNLFKPGRAYEIRFESMTDPDTKGSTTIQTVGDWKSLGTIEFTSTDWRWNSYSFVMPESGDIQLTFNSRTNATDRFVSIRSVEIVDLGQTRYALDLSRETPFSVQGQIVVEEPNRKVWTVTQRSGTGQWPAGWTGRSWREMDEVEYFLEKQGETNVLGSRTIVGKGSAMLISPEIHGLSGQCQVELEYQTEGPSPFKPSVRFIPTQPTKDKAFDISKLESTAGEWKSVQLEGDLRGATAGRIELHNSDSGPGGTLRIRHLKVSAVESAVAAANPTEGPTLHTLSFASLKPFRCTYTNKKTDFDLAAALPKEARLSCWKPESVAEFRANDIEGKMALGMTNLNDELSSQLLTYTVNGLVPSQRYRIHVSYLTKNDSNGKLAIRKPKENHSIIASANLKGTSGQWQTIALDFTRPEAGVDVDLQVTNLSIGEGNTMYVHEIKVIQLESKAAPLAVKK